jgi:hypothetical protein
MTDDRVERVAKAIEAAQNAVSYRLELTRLVDGLSTYTLTYADGEKLEFDDIDDGYLHIEQKKRLALARAAISAHTPCFRRTASMTDDRVERVERVARAVSVPLANMTGGCFKPDNGRSQRGECGDGDCYCARVARHVARAAISAHTPVVRNEAMEEALIKCRDKFRHYEDLHRLKCTPEGDEKADRNREMADMCEAALSTRDGPNG